MTTRALIESVRGLRFEAIPEEAREAARHCLLDFVGCALAGSREPLSEVLVRELAVPEGSREAALLGRSERASRLSAALVNGTAGHALDFDDTHTTLNGHPSVPVLPALFALAEGEPASGAALLTAFVAGVELECRLGLLLGPAHYAAGFHATATLGAFGAAAACAHWLGLDEPGWHAALGLAAVQAAGLKAAFGSMAKPFQAGRAASAGLLAALLARGGLTAPDAVLEAPQGFAATHAGAALDPAALERVRGRCFVRETLFKYHAACYLTHAAIEAASRLRREGSPDPEKIERVEVCVAPELLGVCNIEAPRTGLEGKFSLRATVALALLAADTSDPALYSDGRMADPALVALRDRVRVTTESGRRATCARVRVHWAGATLEAEEDTGVPARDLGLQRERLLHKFDALAGSVLGRERATRLAELCLSVEELADAAALIRLAAV